MQNENNNIIKNTDLEIKEEKTQVKKTRKPRTKKS